MAESVFTGPGEVLLAPETWGDITPIVMDGTTIWSLSKHAFLASTMGIVRSVKSQGFAKGLCVCSPNLSKYSRSCTFFFSLW